jgi:methyl-accepting chemotaxis protein
LRSSAQSLGISLDGISTEGTAEDVRLLTERFEQFASEGISTAQVAAQQITGTLGEAKGSVNGLTQEVNNASDGFTRMQESANQMDAIAHRIKDFVSATGVIRFFT